MNLKGLFLIILTSIFCISCSYLKTTSIRLEGQYGEFGGAIEFNPQKSKDNLRPTFELPNGEEAYLISEKELYLYLKSEKEKYKNLEKLNQVKREKKLKEMEQMEGIKIKANPPYIKPIQFFNMIVKLSEQ